MCAEINPNDVGTIGTVQCPNCGKIYKPTLQRPEGDDRLIQDIFPESTSEEREQLMTGICSDECWDQFLG